MYVRVRSCFYVVYDDFYETITNVQTYDPSVAIGSNHDPFARPTLEKGNEAFKFDQ